MFNATLFLLFICYTQLVYWKILYHFLFTSHLNIATNQSLKTDTYRNSFQISLRLIKSGLVHVAYYVP